MRTYRIYVQRENNAISENDLIKQYMEDRTGNFLIKEQFASNYDIRVGTKVTLSDEHDEVVYNVKVVLIQSTQIALIAETLRW